MHRRKHRERETFTCGPELALKYLEILHRICPQFHTTFFGFFFSFSAVFHCHVFTNSAYWNSLSLFQKIITMRSMSRGHRAKIHTQLLFAFAFFISQHMLWNSHLMCSCHGPVFRHWPPNQGLNNACTISMFFVTCLRSCLTNGCFASGIAIRLSAHF